MVVDPALAISISVALHVVWNLLARSSGDASGFLWWGMLGHCVVAGPSLVALIAAWDPSLWYWLAISTVGIVGYMLCLGPAYDRAPAAVVYPIARSSPLTIALVAWLLGIDALPPIAWAGIVISVLGLWLLARAAGRLDGRGLPWALGAAGCTTVYALSDRRAALVLGDAWSALGFVTAIYATTLVVLTAKRLAQKRGLPARPPVGRWLTGSLCIGSAYALVIHAMRGLPAAEAVAYTNAGIVVAVILGVTALRERAGWIRRSIASTVICLGLLVLALGD